MNAKSQEENELSSKEKQSSISKRFVRLLRIVYEVRANPRQSLKDMLQKLGISRTQYYADKAILEECGLKFRSHPQKGFLIESDGLNFSRLTDKERLAMAFIFSDPHISKEDVVALQALEAGRKFLGELDTLSGRAAMVNLDLSQIALDSGVSPEILDTVRKAMAEERLIDVLYERSMDWTERWRRVYPRYLYSCDGFLYLYARTHDESPMQWKVFRLVRIKKVCPTDICLREPPEDDGNFVEKYKNIFMGYIGLELHRVKIRIKGVSRNFVKNERIHHSQKFTEDDQGNLILTLHIPEPVAAKYWAMKYGDDAEILEPEFHGEAWSANQEDGTE